MQKTKFPVVIVAKALWDTREWLRRKAYEERTTMSAIVREMLEAAQAAEEAMQ